MSEYTLKVVKGDTRVKIDKIPATPFVAEVYGEKYIVFTDVNNNELYHCAGLDGKYYRTYEESMLLSCLNNTWDLKKAKLVIE